MNPAILLMGHGSPDADACAELRELRDLLSLRLRRPVSLGVLEFPSSGLPPLEEAFAELGSVQLVVAQPLLLFQGLHGRQDMPRVAEDAAARLGVEVRLGEPFGQDPELVRLAASRLARLAPGPGDLLLFVGRGSSEPRARRQTEEVAAMVASRAGIEHAVCYTGISRPLLAEGMELALARRPGRILAVPYLLHAGVLARRVAEILQPLAAQAAVELTVLPHLGNAPQVIELVASRVEALLGARATGALVEAPRR